MECRPGSAVSNSQDTEPAAILVARGPAFSRAFPCRAAELWDGSAAVAFQVARLEPAAQVQLSAAAASHPELPALQEYLFALRCRVPGRSLRLCNYDRPQGPPQPSQTGLSQS